MLSDLCSSTPNLRLPLCVGVSLPLSPPLCSVQCVYRLAVCVPANWQTPLWSGPSPGGNAPLALLSSCLFAHARTHTDTDADTDTHTHTLSTFTYTHSCAHHRGRARWCEIDGERKRERAEALMCSTFSVFMFQTAAIITNRNVKKERLRRDWMTADWPFKNGQS